MSDKIVVDINYLKTIAIDLDNKKKEVDLIFHKRISSLLNKNAKYLNSHGLSFKEEVMILRELLKKFDNDMSGLIEALNKGVIPNYEEFLSGIKSLFNDKLVTDINDLLK